MMILGVDGGGSKTAARLAHVDSSGDISVVGEGMAGPSNVRAVGIESAIENLETAIQAARASHDSDTTLIDVAILALAGSSRADVRDQVNSWAEGFSLAQRVDVIPDTEPVLALGMRESIGIALIVGTGSVATGVGPSGSRVMIGGWGHWFGDHGSGYDLGRRALAAMANAVDEIGEKTVLVDAIVQHLGTDDPRDALGILGRSTDMRREIATLAPLLIKAAMDGDQVAEEITLSAARASARLVAAAADKLDLGKQFPLGIAGGIVCNSAYYRQHLLETLAGKAIQAMPLTIIDNPVEGALLLARDEVVTKRQQP